VQIFLLIHRFQNEIQILCQPFIKEMTLFHIPFSLSLSQIRKPYR